MAENNTGCPECHGVVECVKDADYEDNKLLHYFPMDKKLPEIVEKYQIPFKCKTCGSIKFPYQSLHGVVFVWPKPIPETQGKVFIPETLRSGLKSCMGIVMSSGKGCVNKRSKKFVESELQPGDIIIYDKNIPWHQPIPCTDGKTYEVDVMNILDVHATVTEEDL
jgi:co-chaperonin GroES (HSP10)